MLHHLQDEKKEEEKNSSSLAADALSIANAEMSKGRIWATSYVSFLQYSKNKYAKKGGGRQLCPFCNHKNTLKLLESTQKQLFISSEGAWGKAGLQRMSILEMIDLLLTKQITASTIITVQLEPCK